MSVNGLIARNNKITDQRESKTDDYHLIWQDNFDGNKLDETNNWSIVINGDSGGNRELQYYRRENIEVGKEPISGENCLNYNSKGRKLLGTELYFRKVDYSE